MATKDNENYALLFKKLANLYSIYSNSKNSNENVESCLSTSLCNAIKDFGENHSTTAQCFFSYGVFLKDIGGKEEIGMTMIYKAYQIGISLFGETDRFVRLAFDHLCGKRKIINNRKKLTSLCL